MTRKDYEVLAEALQGALEDADQGGEFRGVMLAASRIANVLEQDNPRFDRRRWVAAVVDLKRYQVGS